MQKILVVFILFSFLFSCINETNKNVIKDSFSESVVVGFSITSKNPQLTANKGVDVSLNQMITKNIYSGDNILFKHFSFTLDNKIDGALNFYSKNGKLMCNIPTDLSVMSMPPDGSGITTWNKGDNIELSDISLIKIDSVNFVISDIIFNDKK